MEKQMAELKKYEVRQYPEGDLDKSWKSAGSNVKDSKLNASDKASMGKSTGTGKKKAVG
jgi:hypothetical protein